MIVINMRFWWLRLFFPSSLPFIIIDACGCRLSFIIFRLASSLWKNVCIQLVFAHFIGPPIKFTSNVFRNFKNNLRWLGKFHFGKLRVGWADNFWELVKQSHSINQPLFLSQGWILESDTNFIIRKIVRKIIWNIWCLNSNWPCYHNQCRIGQIMRKIVFLSLAHPIIRTFGLFVRLIRACKVKCWRSFKSKMIIVLLAKFT